MFGKDVVFRRLGEIMRKRVGQSLFPPQLAGQKAEFSREIPSFVYEMRHFSELAFKRFFITQKIVEGGRYEMLLNKNGQFVQQLIDDYVPVHKRDEAPIWGLSFEKPWEVLLAKFWAKQRGNYSNIFCCEPFEFIEHFSPCNWRHYQLIQ